MNVEQRQAAADPQTN